MLLWVLPVVFMRSGKGNAEALRFPPSIFIFMALPPLVKLLSRKLVKSVLPDVRLKMHQIWFPTGGALDAAEKLFQRN